MPEPRDDIEQTIYEHTINVLRLAGSSGMTYEQYRQIAKAITHASERVKNQT